MDASNYTGALTDSQCDDLLAAGVVGVIVQAITGLDGNSYTRQQLQKCVDKGLRIQGYVWCFPNADVSGRLSMFDGFGLEHLWLDVEQQGLTTANVQRDLDLCDSYTGGTTGVYTGKWFWDQMGWSTLWSVRPLWDSNYDGVADPVVNFRPYGGWTHPTVKQYAGTSHIGNVFQIDLDAA